MRICYVILLFTFLLGCAEQVTDKRLAHVADIVAEDPEQALKCLDSLEYQLLSERDRHYFDLLTIKARDKAYITHTSDSLILDVMDYYSSHGDDRLNAEASYYAGRVYCDLGDSPTALQYFHKALDKLKSYPTDIDLKASIISQTGRLLDNLRLYDEAIPYIKEAIKIDETLKDTVNMVYDIQLLGGIYLRAEEYSSAKKCFYRAIELSKNLPTSFRVKSRMYLAEIEYETGHLESALTLIRETPDSVSERARNSALSYASTIYLDNGVLDTAYMYAQELLHSPDQLNRGIAYETLLSPQMQSYLPQDSIYPYLSEYIALLESDYDENEVKMTVIQQGYYNYNLHLNEKQTVTHRNLILNIWLLILISLCLVLATAVLYYKNRNSKIRIDYQNALLKIDKLKEIKRSHNTEINPANVGYSEHRISTDFACLTAYTVKDLRKRLQKELQELNERNESTEISDVITGSEVYMKLMMLIAQNRTLTYEDPLWCELGAVVEKASPGFRDKLEFLTQGRMTLIDIHTALLVKCSFTPSQMCILLGRSKGAIVSRRDSLCKKIFGRSLGTKVIDGIIRLL